MSAETFVSHPNADTASYTIPKAVGQFIESVYVEIDNTAGADTTPVLSLVTPAGDTFAAKEQGRVMPGGGSGSATWALRLGDEQSGSVRVLSAAYFQGSVVTINDTQTSELPLDAFLNIGTEMWDYATFGPGEPAALAAGLYTLMMRVIPHTDITIGGRYTVVSVVGVPTTGVPFIFDSVASTTGQKRPEVWFTVQWSFAKEDWFDVSVTNLDGAHANDFAVQPAYVGLFT